MSYILSVYQEVAEVFSFCYVIHKSCGTIASSILHTTAIISESLTIILDCVSIEAYYCIISILLRRMERCTKYVQPFKLQYGHTLVQVLLGATAMCAAEQGINIAKALKCFLTFTSTPLGHN